MPPLPEQLPHTQASEVPERPETYKQDLRNGGYGVKPVSLDVENFLTGAGTIPIIDQLLQETVNYCRTGLSPPDGQIVIEPILFNRYLILPYFYRLSEFHNELNSNNNRISDTVSSCLHAGWHKKESKVINSAALLLPIFSEDFVTILTNKANINFIDFQIVHHVHAR